MTIPIRDFVSILISMASLLLSGYAVWVTQFNRGRLKMTQPSLVCLKREFPGARPKIFLRTCLFTTGTKGYVVEHLFLRVRNQIGRFVFDFWGYATDQAKLTLGSGLFVGATGIVSDHHFNPHEGTDKDFLYCDGDYEIEVFATLVGRKAARRLFTIAFTVKSEQAAEVIQIPTREMFLIWNADLRRYDAYVRHDNRPLQGQPLGAAVNESLASLFFAI